MHTAHEIMNRLNNAALAGERQKVYNLTRYAEQESAYRAANEPWAYVARAGRNTLAEMDREAAYAAGRRT